MPNVVVMEKLIEMVEKALIRQAEAEEQALRKITYCHECRTDAITVLAELKQANKMRGSKG